MTLEILVGLFVSDDALYRKYREAMMPILESYGGGFGYDFRIADVLKSETDNPINRVFTICFADTKTKDAFFSDEKYLDVRSRYFEPAVSATTIIAQYQK